MLSDLGTTVKATNKEHKIAKHTVKAIGPNKIDASPSVIIIGTNTAKTVVVAAITALPTSEVPAKAASVDDLPSKRCRYIFSNTTFSHFTNPPSIFPSIKYPLPFFVFMKSESPTL